MNATQVKNIYLEVCKSEGISPLPIKFTRVAKGGACLEYNTATKKPTCIKFDLNRCMDLEYAIYHETAHQILMESCGDPAHRHNAKFRKIESRLNDTYMYSDLIMKHLVN